MLIDPGITTDLVGIACAALVAVSQALRKTAGLTVPSSPAT